MRKFETYDYMQFKQNFNDLSYGDFFTVSYSSGVYQKITPRDIQEVGLAVLVFDKHGFKAGYLQKFADDTAVHVASMKGHFEVSDD